MRTFITETTVYNFKELSNDAQRKALENLWDVNVDHDWWDSTDEDAARIGLEITEFDTYRGTIDGRLTEHLLDCCKLIRREHGKECETFKTAKVYLAEYTSAFRKWLDAKTEDEMELWELDWTAKEWLEEFCSTEDAEEITRDFTKSLLEDYLIILRKEYDYLTSEESIKESILANEYEFTEDGELA